MALVLIETPVVVVVVASVNISFDEQELLVMELAEELLEDSLTVELLGSAVALTITSVS